MKEDSINGNCNPEIQNEFQVELKEKLNALQKNSKPQSNRKRSKMRPDMDHDYREYFRERPRGEFLTRGAALASSNANNDFPTIHSNRGLGLADPNVYSVSQRNVNVVIGGPGGGADISHEQLEREPRRYGRSNNQSTKENRRNPTILRKSNQLIYSKLEF